jgi:hypothetical protein
MAAIAAVLGVSLCLGATHAVAGDLEVTLDGRFVAADGRRSFLDGGLGKLRYGDDAERFEVGRLRLGYQGTLGEILHFNIDASAWSADDTNPIDLTEAFFELRPYPASAWRSRLKAGVFYPPISLEHRARGWTNPYALSSSALNTWVGEELRTIGLEYDLEWLGAQSDSAFDFGLSAAAYGWNDPAGVIVAFRGFALHDRQTPLFGYLRTFVPGGGRQNRVLFAEIDDRPGYYVGGYARYAGRAELRALRYDNRADPAAYDAGIQDGAWKTKFDSLGFRYDGERDFTLIAQWLSGETVVGSGALSEWYFDASFLLAAKQFGRHRFAARADRFAMTQEESAYPGTLGDDRGKAWTLAWTFEPRERLEITTEWLEIDSTFNWRRQLREDPRAVERALQLGLRYTFDFTP